MLSAMRVKSPFSQSALFGFMSFLPSRDLAWRRMRLGVRLIAEPSIQCSGYNYGLKESRQSATGGRRLLRGPRARRRRLSGVDPLNEPVEDSRPDLVLADLVLDPVFEVRVVVDLDDDDRAVRFLDVDAIETRTDRARGLERRVDDGRGRIADRKCLRAAFPRSVRSVFDNLPMAARHLILAHKKRFAFQDANPPIEFGRHEFLRQQEVGVLEKFVGQLLQLLAGLNLVHAARERAVG